MPKEVPAFGVSPESLCFSLELLFWLGCLGFLCLNFFLFLSALAFFTLDPFGSSSMMEMFVRSFFVSSSILSLHVNVTFLGIWSTMSVMAHAVAYVYGR